MKVILFRGGIQVEYVSKILRQLKKKRRLFVTTQAVEMIGGK